MLIESKYRISIKQSVHAKVIYWCLYCLLLSSVWFWSATDFPFQLIFQMCICTILTGWFIHNRPNQENSSQTILLGEHGSWENLNPHKQEHWKIMSESRVSSWLLWLKLKNYSGQTQWKWIFSDAVDDISFRRLARGIKYQQLHANRKAFE